MTSISISSRKTFNILSNRVTEHLEVKFLMPSVQQFGFCSSGATPRAECVNAIDHKK